MAAHSLSRAAHGVERALCAATFTLLAPVGFGLLILSGLLLALAVASVL